MNFELISTYLKTVKSYKIKYHVIVIITFGAHARSEGYCSCPVCVRVCLLISAASHIGITKEKRDTNGFIYIYIAIQRLF